MMKLQFNTKRWKEPKLFLTLGLRRIDMFQSFLQRIIGVPEGSSIRKFLCETKVGVELLHYNQLNFFPTSAHLDNHPD
jgi:hypothetical protein